MAAKADLVIRNGWVVTPAGIFRGGVAMRDGVFVAIGLDEALPSGEQTLDAAGRHILPGLIDTHVHFREPGLTHKEDLSTGSAAAACGGVTTVLEMPNTVPPTGTVEAFRAKKALAESKSYVDVGLYAVVLQDNVEQLEALAEAGVVAFKLFMGETTGGIPAPDDGRMLEACAAIARTGLVLAVHAENNPIIQRWMARYKAEGRTDPKVWDEARPAIAEIEAIQRAILFCDHYRTKLHIVHLTAREALPLIVAARARGLRITAETCPHYVFLDSSQANLIGTLSRMNPPIRSKEDAEALWAGLLSGRVDSIATDHAPHTREEKVKPSIWDVQSGFPGVETYLPLFLTAVNQNRMSLTQLVRLACENPARIFGLFPQKGAIRVGSDADLVLVDLEKEGKIEAVALHSKSKISPYDGWKVKGLPAMTLVRGHVVMRDGEPVGPPRGRVIRPDPKAP